MANTISTETNLFDSAIGPMIMETEIVEDFDVDDYAHMQCVAQALKLQVLNTLTSLDKDLAKDRPPVIVEDKSAGGF